MPGKGLKSREENLKQFHLECKSFYFSQPRHLASITETAFGRKLYHGCHVKVKKNLIKAGLHDAIRRFQLYLPLRGFANLVLGLVRSKHECIVFWLNLYNFFVVE